jgi:positive regulator of sigma E activity
MSLSGSQAAMSAFMLYVIGFFILLGGLVYAAFLLHVPQTWIIVGTLIVLGLGVMSAVSHTKRRDESAKAPDA